MSKQKNAANGQSTIKLTCIKCNETTPVTTNYPEKYTEEVLKAYVCTHCKSVRGGKKSVFVPAIKQTVPKKEIVKEVAKEVVKEAVKEAEKILEEDTDSPIVKPITQTTTLTEAEQIIVSDTVIEIMEDLEKLGAYTDLRTAVKGAISIALTKKLPKEKIKDAMLLSKNYYLIR